MIDRSDAGLDIVMVHTGIQTMTDTMRKQYRELSEKEQFVIDGLKQLGDQFLGELDHLPPAREFALARTKMEEAVMWAVKGITR